MKQSNILLKPIVTEKSMASAAANRYSFQVARRASKSQIKHAVEGNFNVDVIKINTIKQSGNRRRVGRYRKEVKRADTKKAIVTIKEGQKIEIFEAQT